MPPQMPQETNAFLDKLLAVKGDIFLGCNIGLHQYKLFILKLIHGDVQLESHTSMIDFNC